MLAKKKLSDSKPHRVVCENIRSAYNVGNIIRTADALWWGVILSWYSAPIDHKKVKKTALGAEESVPIKHFHNNQDAVTWCKGNNLTLISAEKTLTSIPLDDFIQKNWSLPTTVSNSSIFSVVSPQVALILGNELFGVEQSTLDQSDYIVHIPMQGIKESLNVGQAWAILMRALWKNE